MTLDADSLGSIPTINFDLFSFTLTGLNLTTLILYCQLHYPDNTANPAYHRQFLDVRQGRCAIFLRHFIN